MVAAALLDGNATGWHCDLYYCPLYRSEQVHKLTHRSTMSSLCFAPSGLIHTRASAGSTKLARTIFWLSAELTTQVISTNAHNTRLVDVFFFRFEGGNEERVFPHLLQGEFVGSIDECDRTEHRKERRVEHDLVLA